MFTRALAAYRGRLIIACSGGADSLSLAHAATLAALKREDPPPIWLYVNHGLRPEAGQEAKQIAAQASAAGAGFVERCVQVSNKGSLEAAARDARYAALDSEAKRVCADWVLLGHTRTDQVETIFMRMVRGTGLVGLAGMPKHRGIYARPLLELSRLNTEKYCEKNNLQYIRDPMNLDSRFTRVRVRRHFIPLLREENPKVEEALLRLADSARDHRDVLDWAARQFLKNVASGKTLRVGEPWRELPDSLAMRALVLHAQESGREGLESSHLDPLLTLVREPTAGSTQISLPGGPVWRHYERLAWSQEDIHFDSPVVTEPLPQGYQLRHFRAGDRMRPTRLKGRSRKLSDLFADAKVPRTLRAAAQVIVRSENDAIVWAQYLGYSFDAADTFF